MKKRRIFLDLGKIIHDHWILYCSRLILEESFNVKRVFDAKNHFSIVAPTWTILTTCTSSGPLRILTWPGCLYPAPEVSAWCNESGVSIPRLWPAQTSCWRDQQLSQVSCLSAMVSIMCVQHCKHCRALQTRDSTDHAAPAPVMTTLTPLWELTINMRHLNIYLVKERPIVVYDTVHVHDIIHLSDTDWRKGCGYKKIWN